MVRNAQRLNIEIDVGTKKVRPRTRMVGTKEYILLLKGS